MVRRAPQLKKLLSKKLTPEQAKRKRRSRSRGRAVDPDIAKIEQANREIAAANRAIEQGNLSEASKRLSASRRIEISKKELVAKNIAEAQARLEIQQRVKAAGEKAARDFETQRKAQAAKQSKRIRDRETFVGPPRRTRREFDVAGARGGEILEIIGERREQQRLEELRTAPRTRTITDAQGRTGTLTVLGDPSATGPFEPRTGGVPRPSERPRELTTIASIGKEFRDTERALSRTAPARTLSRLGERLETAPGIIESRTTGAGRTSVIARTERLVPKVLGGAISFAGDRPLTTGALVASGFGGKIVLARVAASGGAGLIAAKGIGVVGGATFVGSEGIAIARQPTSDLRAIRLGESVTKVGALGLGARLARPIVQPLTSQEIAAARRISREGFGREARGTVDPKTLQFQRDVIRSEGSLSVRESISGKLIRGDTGFQPVGKVTTTISRFGIPKSVGTAPLTGRVNVGTQPTLSLISGGARVSTSPKGLQSAIGRTFTEASRPGIKAFSVSTTKGRVTTFFTAQRKADLQIPGGKDLVIGRAGFEGQILTLEKGSPTKFLFIRGKGAQISLTGQRLTPSPSQLQFPQKTSLSPAQAVATTFAETPSTFTRLGTTTSVLTFPVPRRRELVSTRVLSTTRATRPTTSTLSTLRTLSSVRSISAQTPITTTRTISSTRGRSAIRTITPTKTTTTTTTTTTPTIISPIIPPRRPTETFTPRLPSFTRPTRTFAPRSRATLEIKTGGRFRSRGVFTSASGAIFSGARIVSLGPAITFRVRGGRGVRTPRGFTRRGSTFTELPSLQFDSPGEFSLAPKKKKKKKKKKVTKK